MSLHNDVIQESQLVYGNHTEHLNFNISWHGFVLFCFQNVVQQWSICWHGFVVVESLFFVHQCKEYKNKWVYKRGITIATTSV